MWVPEHAHIPTSRQTPHPSAATLPEGYLHMMNPFVSLAAAAAVTERLMLGTAVSLILQHDVVDLATETASLDVISGGRLLLGVGVGWNVEELADHRPELPFRQALRRHARNGWPRCGPCGRTARPASDGKWDKVSPSWVFPKPVHGTVPIVLGNWGPIGRPPCRGVRR